MRTRRASRTCRWRRGSEGKPTGWTLGIGATQSGEGTTSRVEALDGGGLAITGDSGTVRWSYVSQQQPTRAGRHWRLSATGRGLGMTKEDGQYGSAYVGLAFKDEAGAVISRHVRDIRRPAWIDETLHVEAPRGAFAVEVAIFLSMTGRLEVKRLSVREMRPEDSLLVLDETFAREYPFFAQHGIDWSELLAAYAPALDAAEDAEAFRAALQPLLLQLADPHVTLKDAAGNWLPGPPAPTPNASPPEIMAALPGLRQVGQIALLGKTPEGFGYVLLGSLMGPQAHWNELMTGLLALRDETPGMIFDLRLNVGGDERIAQQIVQHFADERRVYAHNHVRSGPGPDDLLRVGSREIGPPEGESHTAPIATLLGPFCMSSGEGDGAHAARPAPRALLRGAHARCQRQPAAHHPAQRGTIEDIDLVQFAPRWHAAGAQGRTAGSARRMARRSRRGGRGPRRRPCVARRADRALNPTPASQRSQSRTADKVSLLRPWASVARRS